MNETVVSKGDFSRGFSSRRGSNPRPVDWESSELTFIIIIIQVLNRSDPNMIILMFIFTKCGIEADFNSQKNKVDQVSFC